MTLICALCLKDGEIAVIDGNSVCKTCLVENFVNEKRKEKK